MTVEDLINALKEKSLSKEAIEAFHKRQEERDRIEAEYMREQANFNYDFRYTL